MDELQDVAKLGALAKVIFQEKVNHTGRYSAWAKDHQACLEQWFGYERRDKMPAINYLVNADFHPELPLVMFNYSKAAHNELHKYENKGWTPLLKLCRGIVFDYSGCLVAKPFPKFFGYGEHPETMSVPEGPFWAMVKEDGHLGIIFNYDGKLILTTRGRFNSASAQLGNQMLRQYADQGRWQRSFPDDFTLLVEMIHPETKVYLSYNGWQGFITIGAYRNSSLYDYSHEELAQWAQVLGLPVVELWPGNSIDDLIAMVKDRSVENREGFVVRFANNLRMKFKFESYVRLMIQDKISLPYLINRLLEGNVESRINLLEEETYPTAIEFLQTIDGVLRLDQPDKDKWRKLYTFLSPEHSSAYYKGLCRKLVKANPVVPCLV